MLQPSSIGQRHRQFRFQRSLVTARVARRTALLCAFLMLTLGVLTPVETFASASHSAQQYLSVQTAPAALSGQSYAYAAYAATDSYDIMLADSSGKDRRVARIKVDSVFFSDVTAQLSADGSKIAFRVTGDRNGGSSLNILDVKSGKSDQIASTKSTAESIGSYMWSPAGGVLAYVRTSPAPYPADVDDTYGSIFVYLVGQGAIRLGGTHGNERVAGFSSDGKGVYVSRRESIINTTLESLVYLPLSGGEGTPLIKSQPGLRYSHFDVWSEPGSPAKVVALAEGNFVLALAPNLPASPTSKPTASSTTVPPTQASPSETPTPEATATQPGNTGPENTAEPLGTLEAGATHEPEATPLLPSSTATLVPPPDVPTLAPIEPPATETPLPEPTAMSSTSSRVSLVSNLSAPGAMGIVVSDPAGTMPTLLRRDAEAYSYVGWTRDGMDIVVGGTRSGATWGVGLDGSRHSLGVALDKLQDVGWTAGSTVVLSDNPATHLVTLDVSSGAVTSNRAVGTNPQAASAALKFSVPYIHQVNDTASEGNGNWACGPTSITMALAYYGRLEPWSEYVADQAAESGIPVQVPVVDSKSISGSDFAPYITNIYSAYGRTYSATSGDPNGNKLAGLYGTICPTGSASWQAMTSVLESHGLASQYVSVTWDGVIAALKRGHPVVLGNELTAAGHIILVIGYTPDGNLVVNDPYGNRFQPGYGGNSGRGVIYPWKRVTPRRALEVIGTYPPPPRPTRTRIPNTATPLPTTTSTATSTQTPISDVTADPLLPTETALQETPLPGISTPELSLTATPEELAPIPTNTLEPETEATVEPTYEPTVMPEETPSPTFNVSNLVLQLPVLLAAIGFAIVKRRGE